MSDNEEGGENASRGNEWEVVSLTASAYAAAPGPEEVESSNNDEANIPEEEAETSRALFMSSHFVFPPSEHENLPLEPDISDENVVTELAAEEEGRSSGKDEETFKGLSASDDFSGIQLFNEKVSDFEDETNLQGLNLIDEQNLYNASKYTSFPNETTLGGSTPYGEDTTSTEFVEPLEHDLDARDITCSPRTYKDDGHDGSRFAGGAWWKRGASSLYSYAKEANAFWSIFIAAAVMGLVILGQQWQQERWQTLQLKWQFNLNNEVCAFSVSFHQMHISFQIFRWASLFTELYLLVRYHGVNLPLTGQLGY